MRGKLFLNLAIFLSEPAVQLTFKAFVNKRTYSLYQVRLRLLCICHADAALGSLTHLKKSSL